MITEDYVSFETAKLLNTKGFKGEFHKHYWGYEPGKEFLTDGSFNPEYDYPAPTLQMAMKWLREVHNIYIQIMLDSWALGDHSGYYIVIQKTDSDFEEVSPVDIDVVFFQTYEEACETAIKYCLEKLI